MQSQLQVRIESIFLTSRRTCGRARIQMELSRQGCRHGRNRIGLLMRQNGFAGRQRNRYRVPTTDSRTRPLGGSQSAGATARGDAGQSGVSSEPQLCVHWRMLAPRRWHSRRVVRLAISSEITTALTLAAWQQAWMHRPPRRGHLFHSDRGVQYAGRDYRQALAQIQAVASMSRKAWWYDNAAMESFWSTLKHELVYRGEYITGAHARRAISAYVEVFYNRQRLHSTLGYCSPVDYENRSN